MFLPLLRLLAGLAALTVLLQENVVKSRANIFLAVALLKKLEEVFGLGLIL